MGVFSMVWVGFQHLPTQNDATATWEVTRSWNPWDFYTKNKPTMDWFISFPILLAISPWIRHSPMSNGLLCFTPIIYHIFASNSQNHRFLDWGKSTRFWIFDILGGVYGKAKEDTVTQSQARRTRDATLVKWGIFNHPVGLRSQF